jgi:hypothetical protein
MQQFLDQNPGVLSAGFFLLLWLTIGFVVAAIGGWRSLGERYRTDREFPSHKRWMQTAQMRFLTGYNHVLTVASDSEGIYLERVS